MKKSSRKSPQFYTLKDKNLNDVKIDLNNYRVICNKTQQRKSFYHKYLADLIARKYNNNIDLFREGYVSRSAADPVARKRAQVESRIDRLFKQINILKGELAELETNSVAFPDA